MVRQLRLNFESEPSYSRNDFILSPSNSAAVSAIDAWPAWHGGCLALVGPEGSGKTHLAVDWARRVGATEIRRPEDVGEAAQPRLIEHADRADDELLFLLINMAAVGGGLLLTSRRLPQAWPARLPDLRSRLNALPTIELGAPDDTVLEGLLRKFFRERSIVPADDVYPYLMRRIERSGQSAQAIVERLDEAAGAEGREITRALARRIVEADVADAGPAE